MTSEAPHRIKIRNGYVNEPMPYAPGGGETLSYVLETPTALAADPAVKALVAEAEARGMEAAAAIVDTMVSRRFTTDMQEMLRLAAKSIRNRATAAWNRRTPTALAASPEVAKLIADAEARIINIAAGIFPGGFDNNVAAIRRASEAAP